VLICSDGFLDNYDVNLFEDPSMYSFLKFSSASQIQKILLKAAADNSTSARESPFSRNAKAMGLNYSTGGKKDDINLIVLKINSTN
jgi:hypothetical protein